MPDQMRRTVDRWWICEGGWFGKGGRKYLGPFESRDLALRVREYVETAEGRRGALWIDEESVAASVPAPARQTHNDGEKQR
jgi:hypothetical protein